MRYQGKIIDWKDQQGFGFITIPDRHDKIFVHISALPNRQHRPVIGDQVSFILKKDATGRMQAESVTIMGQSARGRASQSRGGVSLIFALGFLIMISGASWLGWVPVIFAASYLLTSALTLIVYALDKSAAQKNQWRTPENTLHTLALVGGWPGALIAQKWFRHKSSKTSFQFVFWITVIVNCGGLAWVLSPSGHAIREIIVHEFWALSPLTGI
jgi:uncharacterized membrane protein YsdA (DUF1294 family)/cold shock CspA family protein